MASIEFAAFPADPIQIITYNDEFTVFSPADFSMGMFARLAQAINLLDQSLKHVREETMTAHSLYSERGMQLHKTIRSLVHLTRSESNSRNTEDCLQKSTCYRCAT